MVLVQFLKSFCLSSAANDQAGHEEVDEERIATTVIVDVISTIGHRVGTKGNHFAIDVATLYVSSSKH